MWTVAEIVGKIWGFLGSNIIGNDANILTNNCNLFGTYNT